MEIVERKRRSQNGTKLALKVMHYHNGTANPRSFQPQFKPVALRKRVTGMSLLFLTPSGWIIYQLEAIVVEGF